MFLLLNLYLMCFFIRELVPSLSIVSYYSIMSVFCDKDRQIKQSFGFLSSPLLNSLHSCLSSQTLFWHLLFVAVAWGEEETSCLSEYHHLIFLGKVLPPPNLMSLPKGSSKIIIEQEIKGGASDIVTEITKLKSHLNFLLPTLNNSIGKRYPFLACSLMWYEGQFYNKLCAATTEKKKKKRFRVQKKTHGEKWRESDN